MLGHVLSDADVLSNRKHLMLSGMPRCVAGPDEMEAETREEIRGSLDSETNSFEQGAECRVQVRPTTADRADVDQPIARIEQTARPWMAAQVLKVGRLSPIRDSRRV